MEVMVDMTLSSRIVAFAPVSSAYYVDTVTCNATTISIPCTPSRKNISLLAFHGGNDTPPLHTWRNSKRAMSSIHSSLHPGMGRARRSGPQKSYRSDRDRYGAVPVQHRRRNGACWLYFESNIGHDWPSTLPNSDNQAKGHHDVANYDATPIIMKYFEKHPLPLINW